MNILITGGTGFIGKVLINKLLMNGGRVILLVRDKRKIDASLSGKLEVLEADICNTKLLESLNLRSKNIDTIIHLAAFLEYFGRKNKLFRVNIKGTKNLLNLAEENGIEKFIYVSSIEALGPISKEKIPADEISVCSPVSSYGKSKLEAEIEVLKRADKLRVAILRLGNVYGPGSNFLIPPIAQSILNQQNPLAKYLPVYKNSLMNPVYIDDAVKGIIKALQGKKSGIYHIAGEEIISIEDLFKLTAEELGLKFEIKEKKSKKMDILYLELRKIFHKINKKPDLITYLIAGGLKRIHRVYSTEKAKKEIDYYPKVSLKEGVKKTLNWLKEKKF